VVDQEWGSIMWATIFNVIYRRFIEAALPGMTGQGAKL